MRDIWLRSFDALNLLPATYNVKGNVLVKENYGCLYIISLQKRDMVHAIYGTSSKKHYGKLYKSFILCNPTMHK